jgi:hypothetical protein
VQVAVSNEARSAKVADFIVRLKTPVTCSKAPAVGTSVGMQPASELEGTYDTYTKIAATDAKTSTVQILLRDGFVQPEKKKQVVRRPPVAAHKTFG